LIKDVDVLAEYELRNDMSSSSIENRIVESYCDKISHSRKRIYKNKLSAIRKNNNKKNEII
jgi:hypothetical protein